MIDEAAQSEFTQRIYDAVLDSSLWEPLLLRLVDEIGCQDGVLALRLPSPGDPGKFYYPSVDPAWTQTFPYYLARSPDILRGVMEAPVGQAGLIGERIGRGSLERSEFFNDWAIPLGQFDGYFAKVFQEGPDVSMLGLTMTRHKPDVTPMERRFVRSLLPHFTQAIRILRHIEWKELERRDRDRVLDRLAVGIIMVKENGHLQDSNRAGWSILQEACGLQIVRRTVTAERPSEARALRTLIAATARTANGASGHAGGTIAISRTDGRRPLAVTVAPIARETAGLWSDRRPVVALFATDPDDVRPSLQEHLTTMLSITPRQADIVAALARGESLSQVAERLEIGIGTARNYLKDAYRRTGTRRQAELVALATRSAGPLLQG